MKKLILTVLVVLLTITFSNTDAFALRYTKKKGCICGVTQEVLRVKKKKKKDKDFVALQELIDSNQVKVLDKNTKLRILEFNESRWKRDTKVKTVGTDIILWVRKVDIKWFKNGGPYGGNGCKKHSDENGNGADK